MAIAFDAVSQNAANANVTFSWTHTPVGTPRGILVAITGTNTGTDFVTGVTYGGVAMTEVTGSPRTHTAGADDSVDHIYFLGSSIPTGAQTVEVTLSASATNHRAVALSVTAAADTEVDATNGADTGAGTASALDFDIATTASTNTVALGVCHCGEAAAGSLTTDQTEILETDFGAQIAGFARTTGAGGNVPFGWNFSTDTANGFGAAIKEGAAASATFPSWSNGGWW